MDKCFGADVFYKHKVIRGYQSVSLAASFVLRSCVVWLFGGFKALKSSLVGFFIGFSMVS